MQTSFNVLGGDIKPPDLKADLHVFIHLFTQCIFIERLSIPSEDTDKSMWDISSQVTYDIHRGKNSSSTTLNHPLGVFQSIFTYFVPLDLMKTGKTGIILLWLVRRPRPIHPRVCCSCCGASTRTLTNCVTQGKVSDCSEPQFTYLWEGMNNTYQLNKIMFVRYLAPCPIHNRGSINSSCS